MPTKTYRGLERCLRPVVKTNIKYIKLQPEHLIRPTDDEYAEQNVPETADLDNEIGSNRFGPIAQPVKPERYIKGIVTYFEIFYNPRFNTKVENFKEEVLVK